MKTTKKRNYALTLVLFMLLGTLSLSLISQVSALGNIWVQGSNFNILFAKGQSLIIAGDGFTVNITVTSGTWNATNCKILSYDISGRLDFKASKACNLTLFGSNPNIAINVGYQRTNSTTIRVGQTQFIKWGSMVSLFPYPITTFLGIAGFVCIPAGIAFAIYKVKHGEYKVAITIGCLIFFVGVALFIGWLNTL